MSDSRSRLRWILKGGEEIVEVLRDGRVVATIHGSLEGVRIASERLAYESRNDAFFFQGDGELPARVVPLLAASERCPWCEGSGAIKGKERPMLCPVCKGMRE